MTNSFNDNPHRRLNILTGEWILVSPHRTKRPWQGKTEKSATTDLPVYDPSCYLCPTNERMGGEFNPSYEKPYSFVNDFSALLPNVKEESYKNGLLYAESESGSLLFAKSLPYFTLNVRFGNCGRNLSLAKGV